MEHPRSRHVSQRITQLQKTAVPADPRSQRSNPLWTTSHEIAFVAGLGSFQQADRRRLMGRLVLLRRYLAAMPLRQDWGDILQHVVRRTVVDALAECVDAGLPVSS